MKQFRLPAIGATMLLLGLPTIAQANLFTMSVLNLGILEPLQEAASEAKQPAATGGAPDIALVKKCPTMRYVGRDATMEIEVTNRGSGPAQNLVVTDALPAGVDFLDADNNGKREGGNIIWRIGTLEAKQSRTLKINVRCNQITIVRNTATATYCAESRVECEFPVKGVPAILLEMVDDPDPIEIGNPTTYTITVTNQGTAVDTNIIVKAIIPDEEDYASSDGPTKGALEGKTVTFGTLASLAPKDKATWKVVVKGKKEADVRFKVVLKSDATGDVPVEKTESTHIY